MIPGEVPLVSPKESTSPSGRDLLPYTQPEYEGFLRDKGHTEEDIAAYNLGPLFEDTATQKDDLTNNGDI